MSSRQLPPIRPSAEDPSHVDVFRWALQKTTNEDLAALLPANVYDDLIRRVLRRLTGLDPVRVANVAKLVLHRAKTYKPDDLFKVAFLIHENLPLRTRRALWNDEHVRTAPDALKRHVDVLFEEGLLQAGAIRLVLASAVLRASPTTPAVLDLLASDLRVQIDGAASAFRADVTAIPTDDLLGADDSLDLAGEAATAAAKLHDLLAEEDRSVDAFLKALEETSSGLAPLLRLIADHFDDDTISNGINLTAALRGLLALKDVHEVLGDLAGPVSIENAVDALVTVGVDWADPGLQALARCGWAFGDGIDTLITDLHGKANSALAAVTAAQPPPDLPSAGPTTTLEDADPFLSLVRAVDAQVRGDQAAVQGEIRTLVTREGLWASLAGPAAVGLIHMPTRRPDAPVDAAALNPSPVEDRSLSRPAEKTIDTVEQPGSGATRDVASAPVRRGSTTEMVDADEEREPESTPTIETGAGDTSALTATTATIGITAEPAAKLVAGGVATTNANKAIVAVPEAPHDSDPAEIHDSRPDFDDDPAVAAALDKGMVDLLVWIAVARREEDIAAHLRAVVYSLAMRSPTSNLAHEFYKAASSRLGIGPTRSIRLMEWATASRAVLSLPHIASYHRLNDLAEDLADPAAREFTELVATAANAGQYVAADQMSSARDRAKMQERISAAAAAAQSALDHDGKLRYSHHGTTAAWQKMLTDNTSPVRTALRIAADNHRNRRDEAAKLVQRQMRGNVDELARQYDLRPRGDAPIHSTGRRWLSKRIDETADVVSEWIDAVDAAPASAATGMVEAVSRWMDQGGKEKLDHWLAREESSAHPGVTAAARFCRTLIEQTAALLAGTTLPDPLVDPKNPAEALGQSLIRVPGLVVDDFRPINEHNLTVPQLRGATTGTWRDAFQRHADAGNLLAAHVAIKHLVARETPERKRQRLTEKLMEELQGLHELARRQYRKEHRQITERFQQTRAFGALSDSAAADFDHRLAVRSLDSIADDDSNLQAATYALRQLARKLDEATRRHRDNLDAELQRVVDFDLTDDPKIRQAALEAAPIIRALLDPEIDGDLGTAQQMLHAVRRGETPKVPQAAKVAVGGVLDPVTAEADLAALVNDLTSEDTRQAASSLVEAWEQVGTWPRDRQLHAPLRTVLSYLGVALTPAAVSHPQGLAEGTNHTWRQVGPRTVQPSCAARHFDLERHPCWRVLVVRNNPSIERIEQLIAQDTTNGPILVINTGRLTGGQRAAFAASRRRQPERAILLIDTNVIADLIKVGQIRDFTALADRTLPFCRIDPFSPDARESTPDVLFYGREGEVSQLLDPDGPLFVYGGRQLGKSALLSKAGRTFASQRSENVTMRLVLTDYTPAMRASGTLVLLHRIAEELKRLGVPAHTSSDDPVAALRGSVLDWLNHNRAERGILMLLDECDDFLDLDLEANFECVQALKSLMEATGRQVKPIFAGLHQVQRFTKATNHPFAHFGSPIRVGVLDPTVAPTLIAEPLARAGFEFSDQSRQLWRIVQEANYQPGVLHIIGGHLVAHMHKRLEDDARPAYVITDDDIDAVLSSTNTRHELQTRFNNTVVLDDRYRVIANVVSLNSLTDGLDTSMSAADLRKECQLWWKEGFTAGADEFAALLEEMVGLGVLANDPAKDGRYLLFSPRIPMLLGGRDRIEEDLSDTTALKVDQVYSAVHERRLLTDDGPFSPMSEYALRAVTNPEPKVVVVVGTDPAGLDNVATALKVVADEMLDATRFTLKTVPAQRKKVQSRIDETASDIGHNVVVVPLKGAGRSVVEDLIRQAEKTVAERTNGPLTVVFLAGPDQSWIWGQRIADPSVPNPSTIVLRRLDHQTITRLHRIIDPPVEVDDFVHETMSATGGWPALVSQVFTATRDGRKTWMDALATVSQAASTVREAVWDAAGLADPESAQIFEGLVDMIRTDDGSLPYHNLSEELDFDGIIDVLTPAHLNGKTAEIREGLRQRLVRLHVAGCIDLSATRFTIDAITARFLERP